MSWIGYSSCSHYSTFYSSWTSHSTSTLPPSLAVAPAWTASPWMPAASSAGAAYGGWPASSGSTVALVAVFSYSCHHLTSGQEGWAGTAFAGATQQTPSLLGLPPSPLPTVTPQQWNELPDMMQNLSLFTDKFSGNNSWILNFGASRHMTDQQHFLFNIVSISTCYIHLPNSHYCYNGGMCSFGSKFSSHSCLYVPNLTCSLLSISQLLQFYSNYFVE